MSKEKPHSVKNTLKNTALIVLVVLMVVLAGVTWLSGLQISQLPVDSLPRRLYEQAFGGAVGYELRISGIAAAEPIQIAVCRDGQPQAVQYSIAEIDAAMNLVQPVFASALTDAAPEKAEESALIEALVTGRCLLLHYQGALPLSVLAVWLGGTCDADLAVQTLIYSPEDELLFFRTGDGALYSCPASVDAALVSAAQDSFQGQSCRFAGDVYAVLAETLLFDQEALSASILTRTAVDFSNAESGIDEDALRSAFGYTAYASSYPEQEGTVRVIVADSATLRLTSDGLVQYEITGTDGLVSAYQNTEIAGAGALGAQIDCARLIADVVLRTANTGTRAALYAVKHNQGLTTLTFSQTYAGIPILEQEDFASFVFRDGTLVSAELHVGLFVQTEQKQTVLPAAQAAVLATQSQPQLVVAYTGQDGRYVPQRFFAGK